MTPEGTAGLSASRLANLAAPAILAGFEEHERGFAEISRRARGRFARREWRGALSDATERLDLYGTVIGRVEAGVRETLGEAVADRAVWAGLKAVYSGLIAGRPDWEVAETFFNSVTRRIFSTRGVDANIEFVDSDFAAPAPEVRELPVRLYRSDRGTGAVLHAVLADGWFDAPYEDLERDARLAGERLSGLMRALGFDDRVDAAEVVAAPFYRRKGAYLLGRALTSSRGAVPFGLALLNTEQGVVVDAVLAGEDDISILFSFTRSHFQVDLGPPHQLVVCLRRLIPRKPIAEIYIALGHHKHGKTELYRDLIRHLRESDLRFEYAPGTPGMVMIVFTMPGYDVVFKVIRDRFPAIKASTRDGVRQNYRLVFRHDRAGRLVEAQEFEHLEFDRERFTAELVEEFKRDASATVQVSDDRVVVHHAYLERRVTPLDIYLRNASREAAAAAVTDFGQAIKELAANGIFPGELLPKNFGVTRHSRVVCYDYDELSLLTDFCFRDLPASRDDDDEYAEEAWFGVGPRDVFPDELRRFLGLSTELGAVMGRDHGDLYEVGFWLEMQERVRSGEIIDIFPYHPSRRLDAARPGARFRDPVP